MTDNPERATQIVSRLRLATGLVLFSFLLTHFVNHALGMVSLQAMEEGRRLFLAVWRNPIGSVALYGSLLVHFGLALRSVYRRRTLRMAGWEASQLLLGLLIPPLLIAHVVGTRVSHEIAGAEGSYAWVVYVLWVLDPANAVRQIAVFWVAWLHGCIGLHFWLRLKLYYNVYLPVTYAAALLIPTFGLLGFLNAAKTVAELAKDPVWVASLAARVGAPRGADAALLTDIKTGLTAGFWLLLAGTLVARVIRDAIHRRRAITIAYPMGRRIAVRPGTSLLEASRMLNIPQAAVCGGRGRCSTCRTQIAQGLDLLPPPNQQERAVLERIGAPPNVRLACQTEPTSDVSAVPLLSPAEGMRAARRQGAAHGHERDVAVMFTDLRSFTQISEHRLPYDVVFLLNRYFDAMGGAIESVDGHIDKFIGDGVMAVFGIRRPIDEACRRALAAARAMSENLQQLNESLGLEGIEPLRIGIGLHAGPAIVGEMGYGRTTSVTAIGDTVNTANRLEALTKDYDCQLVVSETVIRHAGIASPKCDSHTVVVRGRREPLTVHAIGDAREVSVMEGADGV